MTKHDKLIALYHQREQAIKANYLNDYDERIRVANEYRRIPKEMRDLVITTNATVDIQQASARMWEEFNKLDKPRIVIQSKINDLIKVYNPKVIDIVCEDSQWTVLVEDKKEKFKAWMNAYIDEEWGELVIEWNQDIFHVYDEDDIYQKLHQDDSNVYDYFSSIVSQTLEAEFYVYQDNDGLWHRI